MRSLTQKSTLTEIIATVFTFAAIFLGYEALGLVTAFLFTFGYFGGLVIWLLTSSQPSVKSIAIPYFLTLAFFVMHKIEEREMDFFPALSKITHVPIPDSSSWQAIALYGIACFWLIIPLLIWKKWALGYFLTWTFFASMGITELAHFVLPLFREEPYGYFPGMWSVIGLTPLAWWGMYKLSKSN